MHRNSVRSSANRVLVIDDCDVARMTMCEILREAGFTVLEQASAIGATRVIVQNDVRAAVVDISMPGLSGDKLVSLLRTNPKLQGLVIVVVSARDEVELEQVAREAKADAALSKQYLDERLVPLLNRLLRAAAPAATQGPGGSTNSSRAASHPVNGPVGPPNASRTPK